ncbi:hypothetical protein Nmel_002951, partial [Mimus melanotis]
VVHHGPPWSSRLHGLLDTGANTTILPFAAWPSEWPLDPVDELGVELGGATQSYRSQWLVVVTNEGGQSAAIRPLVASIPFALWGRDVFSLWELQNKADF